MQHPSKLSSSILNNLQQVTSKQGGKIFVIVQRKMNQLHDRLLLSTQSSMQLDYWQQVYQDAVQIQIMVSGLCCDSLNIGLSQLVMEQISQLTKQIYEILNYGNQNKTRAASNIRSISNIKPSRKYDDSIQADTIFSPLNEKFSSNNIENKIKDLESKIEQQRQYFEQKLYQQDTEIKELKEIILVQKVSTLELVKAHNDTAEKINTFYQVQDHPINSPNNFLQPQFQQQNNGKNDVTTVFSLDENLEIHKSPSVLKETEEEFKLPVAKKAAKPMKNTNVSFQSGKDNKQLFFL
ncbi:hypothetical protein SS50377_20910 [Spironucleus salmonicida]|uniref:Uncharacterized protein n=1 Tax=Spironucleus salmonicida TaxID=348837 RepID=V6LS28_9EUKA|nr:hypothetical protein SS50377_20910 [Spironucleus salmonicida]|eukprot:EST43584.1 Hypothetical protein SS50377_16625 [Spironucleus salmonicida]